MLQREVYAFTASARGTASSFHESDIQQMLVLAMLQLQGFCRMV